MGIFKKVIYSLLDHILFHKEFKAMKNKQKKIFRSRTRSLTKAYCWQITFWLSKKSTWNPIIYGDFSWNDDDSYLKDENGKYYIGQAIAIAY